MKKRPGLRRSVSCTMNVKMTSAAMYAGKMRNARLNA
jgi:hypothetical protein